MQRTISPASSVDQRQSVPLTKQNIKSTHKKAGHAALAVLCFIASCFLKTSLLTSTVPLVLSVLGQGESYGYELIQRVRELSAGKIEWTEGMLYPVLHWMESEGQWIESEWKTADSGRKRKYYRLKKEGLKVLKAEQEQWITVHTTPVKLWKKTPVST